MSNQRVFNAQQNLTFSFDRQYRIYAVDNGLVFVRTGGQRGLKEGLLQFGLLGALLFSWWNKNSAKQQAELIQELDLQSPDELISRHQHNFKLVSSDLETGAIEPGSVFGAHGPTIGRCILKLWDERKIALQFDTNEDLKAALEILPKLFGETLTVNVEWNEKESKFQKKTA